MAEFKPFVAVQEFILNVDNGKTEVRVKYGDLIEFDGLNVRCKNTEGQGRSFSRVVRDAEWVKAIAPEKVEILKQRLAGKSAPVDTIKNEGPVTSRNETGGRIVENSDIGSARADRKEQPDREILDLVNKYEDQSFPDSKEDPNKRNVRETKLEQNMPNKNKIINYDDDIVAQVSKSATTDAESKNTAGVEIEDLVESKSSVVSEEERVIKTTNYANKTASKDTSKRLVVDNDAEGVVVRKTSTPAIVKTEVTPSVKVDEDSFSVSNEERVVSETSYDNGGPVDVGSSTKAGVIASKKTVSKKASSKGSVDPQEGVVVRKTSTPKAIETVDGISVKTTVGKNEETSAEVIFSSGGDDIENTEATFSGTGSSVVDLSGIDETDVNVDYVTSLSDDDIDISDLLD